MFSNWNSLQNQKVIVVGDVMLDQTWSGSVDRISPEAPVPVVKIDNDQVQLGGAGNVAVNLTKLGVQAQLHAVVGDDLAGQSLQNLLASYDIISGLQVRPEVTTTQKLRVLSMSQQLIRLDFEEQTSAVDAEQIDLTGCAVLVLSDYMKGALADPQPLIQSAKKQNIPVLADSKIQDIVSYRGVTLFKPNRKEFELLVGQCADLTEMQQKAQDLMRQHDIQYFLITLGKDGMLLVSANGATQYSESRARDVFDVTGAGDTVIATFAAALAAGADWFEAMDLSNRAAGIVVGKLGTASVSTDELAATVLLDDVLSAICDKESLRERVRQAQRQGKKVVMTNGCFDVLHAGHVQYLKQARELGDYLVVAVNTDDSIRRLKGENRPINELEDRLEVLASLHAVDWLVPFAEDTPESLIEWVKPDVLVKGADYQIEDIAGAAFVLANGGEVKTLPLKPGRSSSRIIKSLD